MKMKTQMLFRLQASSERGHSKAMKIAAETQGVESVTLAGKDKDLLLVIGDGVDCNNLTTKLRKKVGHADVVELRTLHDSGRAADYGDKYGYPPASEYNYRSYRSPYPYYNYNPPPYDYHPAGDQSNNCSIM